MLIRRDNARQKHGQDFVVLPPQNFEHHIIAWLQLGHHAPVFLHRIHRFTVDLRDHVTAPESGVIREARRLDIRYEDALLPFQADFARAFRSQFIHAQPKFRRRYFAGLIAGREGTANPPSSYPRLPVMIAVLIPITSPARSPNGPPEFPGLMAASVWINLWNCRPSPMPPRSFALMMPAVTVAWSPNGLPIASTQSPTCTPSEFPSFAVGKSLPASILMTARSVSSSTPTTLAVYFVGSPFSCT